MTWVLELCPDSSAVLGKGFDGRAREAKTCDVLIAPKRNLEEATGSSSEDPLDQGYVPFCNPVSRYAQLDHEEKARNRTEL